MHKVQYMTQANHAVRNTLIQSEKPGSKVLLNALIRKQLMEDLIQLFRFTGHKFLKYAGSVAFVHQMEAAPRACVPLSQMEKSGCQ